MRYVPSDGRLLCPVTDKREVVVKSKVKLERRRCCKREVLHWLCECGEWHKKDVK